MGIFKKIKKVAKKVAKPALGIGAALLAAKALRGRKGPVSTVGQPVGISRAAHKPAHLGETFHPTKWENMARNYKDRIMTGGLGVKGPGARTWDSYLPWNKKDGGRIGAKKGGRVTGIAKRGFGRALMKGKK